MHAVKLVFSVPSLMFVVIFKAKLNYFTKTTPVLFYSACCICFKANILCGSLPCRFNSPGINCDGSGKKMYFSWALYCSSCSRQGRDLCGEHHTALGMLVPDITPPSCRLIVSTQLLVSSILFLSQSCHHQHWPPSRWILQMCLAKVRYSLARTTRLLLWHVCWHSPPPWGWLGWQCDPLLLDGGNLCYEIDLGGPWTLSYWACQCNGWETVQIK